jgi:hypothetical protein
MSGIRRKSRRMGERFIEFPMSEVLVFINEPFLSPPNSFLVVAGIQEEAKNLAGKCPPSELDPV